MSALRLTYVQAWNGSFFHRTTLKSLGLRYQLGHPNGVSCDNPEPCRKGDFVVLDVQAIHHVSLNFCGCGTALPHVTQLLRNRWFPATSTFPQTAATFNALELFQLMEFEGNLSPFEWCHSIERRTDNLGITGVKVCSIASYLRTILMAMVL
jgi:CxC2 like cysteine cluster associated with KDZ transposases